MKSRFIEIIAKDGECEDKKAILYFPHGTQYCNDGTNKSIIPVSDIKEVAYKEGKSCAVLFFSGDKMIISEHEYNRLESILLGGENV